MLVRLEIMVDYSYGSVFVLVHLPGEKVAGELVHDYMAITLDHKAVKDQRRLDCDCGHRPTGLSCNDSVKQ